MVVVVEVLVVLINSGSNSGRSSSGRTSMMLVIGVPKERGKTERIQPLLLLGRWDRV